MSTLHRRLTKAEQQGVIQLAHAPLIGGSWASERAWADANPDEAAKLAALARRLIAAISETGSEESPEAQAAIARFMAAHERANRDARGEP